MHARVFDDAGSRSALRWRSNACGLLLQ